MAPRLFPEGQGWHGPQLRHRHLPHHGPGNHLRRLLCPSIRDDLRCTEGEYMLLSLIQFTPGWWDGLGMESWSGLGRKAFPIEAQAVTLFRSVQLPKRPCRRWLF